MENEPDYILEIGSFGARTSESGQSVHADSGASKGRKYICVQFECCNVYNRIYKNRTGDAYEGYCPRCGKKVKVRIGPDGINARFFRAK